MKKIGLHDWIRRYRGYGKSLIELLIKTGDAGRLPWYSCHKPFQWSDLILPCARRYCRLYKKDTINDWNEVCERLADEWSGNAHSTLRSISIDGVRCKRRHRRLYLFGDMPKWLMKHANDWNRHYEDEDLGKILWSTLEYKAKQRLERWHKIKKLREERSEHTCEKCGAFDDSSLGFMRVKLRWDCQFPHRSIFRGKEPKPPAPWGQMTQAQETAFRKERHEHYMQFRAPVLCVSCWNKERPIYERAREALEMIQLTETLRKELKNGSKKHNQQHQGNTC